jgi:hypothetical protein
MIIYDQNSNPRLLHDRSLLASDVYSRLHGGRVVSQPVIEITPRLKKMQHFNRPTGR